MRALRGRFCDLARASGFHLTFISFAVFATASLLVSLPRVHAQKQQSKSLPKPHRLDESVSWRRDPATGELIVGRAAAGPEAGAQPAETAHSISVVTQIVPVTCSVVGADGVAIQNLQQKDFRVFDDGTARPIVFFDASSQPANVALLIDASPSVLRESEEMKNAARALVDALGTSDETAVVDFSAHSYLQIPFSNDWGLIRKAVGRVDARQLLGDVGGTNIYQAVFVAATELFAGRSGRKAIVLLTDGQDSGLGLTLDPETSRPRPGFPPDRLTFEDVVRKLSAQDIQVFAVSTESRPKIMTADWLASHEDQTLLTRARADEKIPAYTLYLTEMVRRSGGQLYFLREAETLADTFHQIAVKIRAEYTIGFSPADAADQTPRAGWHQLRVEVDGHPNATVVSRASYYVPAKP
ncbi:MAG TPA: VWA domain-containing protein [Candidatus Acidoferrales bacterium]